MNEYYKIEEICKVKGGKRIPQGCTLQDAPNEHPYLSLIHICKSVAEVFVLLPPLQVPVTRTGLMYFLVGAASNASDPVVIRCV